MPLFHIFGKKAEKKEERASTKIVDELDEICRGEPELIEALEDVMFLNPSKIEIKLEEAISKAKKMERNQDRLRAAIWYKIAGGLAIYEGNVSKVKECFSKYSKLTGKSLRILKVPEKAVKAAQKYYSKYLGKVKNELNSSLINH